MNSVEPRHPISYVARRCGLTTHAIRVWERRYDAVRPVRTGKNRRLYSDADIERLRLLKTVTSAGHSIGQIAELGLEELQALATECGARTDPGGDARASLAGVIRDGSSRGTWHLAREWRLYLSDIAESARRIATYKGNRARADVESDPLVYDAILRNLELIGEAARSLPEHVRALAPEISWNGLIGLRELLAHAYFNLNRDVIWEMVDRVVPELADALDQLDVKRG